MFKARRRPKGKVRKAENSTASNDAAVAKDDDATAASTAAVAARKPRRRGDARARQLKAPSVRKKSSIPQPSKIAYSSDTLADLRSANATAHAPLVKDQGMATGGLFCCPDDFDFSRAPRLARSLADEWDVDPRSVRAWRERQYDWGPADEHSWGSFLTQVQSVTLETFAENMRTRAQVSKKRIDTMNSGISRLVAEVEEAKKLARAAREEADRPPEGHPATPSPSSLPQVRSMTKYIQSLSSCLAEKHVMLQRVRIQLERIQIHEYESRCFARLRLLQDRLEFCNSRGALLTEGGTLSSRFLAISADRDAKLANEHGDVRAETEARSAAAHALRKRYFSFLAESGGPTGRSCDILTSSFEELPLEHDDPSYIKERNERRERCRQCLGIAFSDVKVAFASSDAVVERFLKFQNDCPDAFNATYCALALPEMLCPYLEQFILNAGPYFLIDATSKPPPSSFINEIDRLWAKFRDGVDVQSSKDLESMGASFSAELEHRVVIPFLVRSVENFWDPTSPRANAAMLSCVKELVRREASRSQSDSDRFSPVMKDVVQLCMNCIQAVCTQTPIPVCKDEHYFSAWVSDKDALSNDAPAEAEMLSCWLAKDQLCIGIVLLQNISKWHSIAEPSTFQNTMGPFLKRFVEPLKQMFRISVREFGDEGFTGTCTEFVRVLYGVLGALESAWSSHAWMRSLMMQSRAWVVEIVKLIGDGDTRFHYFARSTLALLQPPTPS